jgi:asparagine synthase (glutamine-hydrolysing)
MCGIFGTINMSAEPALLDLIKHRGPDAADFLNLDVGTHRIQLGHRRLAIVDISPAGNQPMKTMCGRHYIVYNGEVYNHQELRTVLSGVPFRGHSDTETILYYLAKKDIHSVKSFNGIFAFAYLDIDRCKLYLVRDTFGVKPLYFFHINNTFGFSSEIKPLLGLVNDTIDLENLAEVLRLRFLPAPDTLFANIKKLRPGHVVEVDLTANRLSVKTYPFTDRYTKLSGLTFDDALCEYQGLMESAVKRQLMSDVEVGILLSGGVDSALVGLYAKRNVSYKMKAFTVGFTEHSQEDEIQDAAQTAKFLGMEHYVARIGFDDFLGALQNCVKSVEEPLATTSMIPMHFLSELAGRHVKVVLSGQGADEPLGGYRRYQGELFAGVLPTFLAYGIKTIVSGLHIKNETILRGLAAVSEQDDISRFIKTYSVFDEDEIKRLVGIAESKSRNRIAYFYDLLGCRGLTHSVRRMMAIDLRMNLADDLLLYTDKITMHHSLECRVPMLDAKLVSFLESIPYSYLLSFFRTKIIHKRLAEMVLPKQIVHRKKKGFFSPTRKWFADGNRLREILLDPDSKFLTYFDGKYVEQVIEEHEKGLNKERHIFLLLSIYYWMSEFL